MNVPTRARLRDTHVTLSHGGGGRAMRDLIDEVFAAAFRPDAMEDQARLSDAALTEPGARLAMTTDSFVVTPLEFPGGDIGKLAICGTVNDLAVGGARPLWLSAAFIIEEGTEIALLRRIVATMAAEAEAAGVRIVTGDTKVVGRGAADGVFVTTTGVGAIPPGRDLAASRIRPGDVALVNGVLGDHGATILAARGDLALSTDIRSDCQALGHLMEAVIAAAPGTRAARDATRGGLASALNEMAEAAGVGVEIEEEALPLRDEVKGMCEILGLDPLYLANEGTLVLFVPEAEAAAALAAMRARPEGRDAVIVGRATAEHPGQVRMRTAFGGARIVDMLVGEQLPRIC
ncbi:hydrogenase expression/formation protein HypE [Rhodovulum sulfidophilum]|uniref:Hydrogenase expression/formation protein HypE n=1 Tax=Rhodovulum visakhapatnamense TaxID=364297 RepID=A0A4R8G4A5_9RHOB|nr:hydrogenase expression/formation protein HypE [Rhodovulum visakhapatnamense]MBL3570728.1 hydrogenase expression/formation protein HypE [Rhodovulum visakhapatnamense]MBL3576867.1 hydrogenase expression/formation protein HypE [Rhodovulum visakhapatnamense]OLS43969.1 hydrogenase expression/formation protein HypE [Rhodovulum sulfidophilum]TDX31342.1 hydrogenase maturation carbamoyl dehydratase HypE [Rhodovulum visakhapatnamense]